MKKKLIGALTLALAGTLVLGLAACGGGAEVHDDILNGGFEQGFTGWTKSGTAFSQSGVVDTNVAGEGKIEAGKNGKYFFSGYDAANAQFTGTLTSDPFVLGGTGKIGFLMGGGMNKEKCYVEFFEEGNDTALAKVSNDAFALGYITDQMVRVVVDLSAHVGKTVYIKVTDDDKGDADEYAYLNLDDFVVYKTDAEVTAAEKERSDKIAAIGKPAFSETETDTTIKNGGFEEGLVNWLMLDGAAFGTRALCKDDTFWADDAVSDMTTTKNRPYNKEGNNFLNTYFDEDATGSIRSTKFTLAGDGIISFLMAGSGSAKNYVALCDGTTDEELETVSFAKTFSDPTFTENMMRHYIDASDYKGSVLYLKVVDGAPTGTGFRGIVVDDFKVSQTKTEVEAQMKADYERSCTVTEPTVATAEQTYYSDYEYPQDCQLTVLRFENRVEGKAVKAGTDVNLESYLSVVTAKYGSNSVDCTKQITGVKQGDNAVTISDYSQATFEAGLYTVGYSVTYEGMTINETFLLDVAPAGAIRNGTFECGSLDGWTVEGSGASVSNGSVYWEGDRHFLDKNGQTVQSYQKEGNYFLITDEGQTVTLKSETFTITGDYISFKFGVAQNPVSYVALCEATSDAEIIRVTNDAFNDPTRAQVMLRRFINVSELKDKNIQVYIKIVDGATRDFGFLDFDDLRINMTANEAQALLEADQDWAETYRQDVMDTNDADFPVVDENIPTEKNRAKEIITAIRGYYTNLTLGGAPAAEAGTILFTSKVEGYAELDAKDITGFNLNTWLSEKVDGFVIGSDETLTITVNEVKEVGDDNDIKDDFTPEAGKQYTVEYTVSYNDNTGEGEQFTFTLNALNDGQIHNGGFEYGDLTGWTTADDLAPAVNQRYTFWGEEMPLNHTGKYLLNAEGDVIAETLTWSMKSEIFTLGGAGIISFKMGGHGAELRVYKADGTQIAAYRNTKFANPGDPAFPYVAQGCRLATMTTYVADLSDYIGEQLYIVIADTMESDFGFACFDDIVTYYETGTTVASLTANEDTVTDGHKSGEEAEETTIPWIEATNSLPSASADDTAD